MPNEFKAILIKVFCVCVIGCCESIHFITYPTIFRYDPLDRGKLRNIVGLDSPEGQNEKEATEASKQWAIVRLANLMQMFQ